MPDPALLARAEAAFRATPFAPLHALIADVLGDAPTIVWFDKSSTDSEMTRVTGYRALGASLTKHYAVVQLAPLGREVAAWLRTGDSALGDLFRDRRVVKGGFESGEAATLPRCGAPDAFIESVAGEAPLWRRYTATFAGAPAFLVVEALLVKSWAQLTLT